MYFWGFHSYLEELIEEDRRRRTRRRRRRLETRKNRSKLFVEASLIFQRAAGRQALGFVS